QNALSQIDVFKELAGVTGLIMTKLDGTARGGVLVAAAEQYGLPIHAIGVGEKIDDLRPFDPDLVARVIAGVAWVSESSKTKKKPGAGWVAVVVDYAPLLIFFGAYKYYAPHGDDMVGEIAAVIRGTGAFIAAAIVALAVSKWWLGKVSPMLWLS